MIVTYLPSLINQTMFAQIDSSSQKMFKVNNFLKKVGIIMLPLGLVLKHLMLPLANLLFVLGATIMILYSYLEFFRLRKENITAAAMMISACFGLIYIMFRLQYWPGTNAHLIAAVAVMVVAMVLYVFKKKVYGFHWWFFVCAVGMAVLLSSISPSRLHYAMRLNPASHQKARDYSYFDWDRYSWYLNQEGKKEEALGANTEALAAYNNAQRDGIVMMNRYISPRGESLGEPLDLINKHRESIMSDSWTEFP